MVYVQDRRAETGALISDTFKQLAMIPRPLAIYFGAFLVLGLAADFIPIMEAPISLLGFVVYFVGQYFLYRELLSANGLTFDPETKILGFFGMAFMLGAAIYFGLFFFLVPGILLGSKWIMAPTYYVAEEVNVFDAVGASWKASGNNLTALALAFTLLFLIFVVATSVAGGASAGAIDALTNMGSGSRGMASISWLAMHTLPVMLMGLSVSAYLVLCDREGSLASVFE